VERGLVEKSGAHFALEGERIGQGRERAAAWLKENPAAMDALAARLMAPPPAAAAAG
jgi:recombination protein RecA